MNQLSDKQLRIGVLISLEGKSSGSGFLYQENDIVYLITAKHVLYDESGFLRHEEILITSQPIDAEKHEITIFKVELIESDIKSHKTSDVLIVSIARTRQAENEKGLVLFSNVEFIHKGTENPVIAARNGILEFDKVAISNDVFVLGYPTSIGLQTSLLYDSSKPLLRKGIVANVFKETKTIILDCPAYGGNSGGPVLQVSYSNGKKQVLIIGIISKYIPYVVKWINSREKIINEEYMNSGYSVAISIYHVL